MAHVKEIRDLITGLQSRYSECFTSPTLHSDNDFVYNMKNCNTISAVLNFTGIMPSGLRHQQYDIYDEKTQVNQSQIDPYLSDVDKIVFDL